MKITILRPASMLIEDLLMLQQKPWKYLKTIQSGSISKDACLCTQKLLNISIPITAVGWSNKAVHTKISYVSLRWLQFCRLVISFPKQVFEKKIFPFVSICLSRLYELVSDGREMWTSVKWITVCSWVLIAFWSMTLDRIVCFSRFNGFR